MLGRLRKISRRIGSELKGGIGGLMATGKSAKGSAGGKSPGKSASGKPASKAGSKSAVKKAPKAGLKPVSKSVAKPPAKSKSKPAAKPSAKSDAKVALKPTGKTNPKLKPTAKVDAKLSGKGLKQSVEPPKAAAKELKKSAAAVTKSSGKPDAKKQNKQPESLGREIDLGPGDEFEGADEFVADIAADMEEAELEAQAPAEPLSPSAALLAVMKPTVSDEKAAEKKKKKDDLKIDRTGDLEAQWQTLKDKNKAIKPLNYKMSESFEARTPILHKVLGWGFIITNQNDRLEVLFQQGIKFLISNYKA